MNHKILFESVFLVLLGLMVASCSNRDFGLPDQNTSFQQTPTFNNKVDILFMSDDSGSMASYRQKMADQATNIVNRLNQMGMDYHIAVTVSSYGSGYSGGTFVGSPKYMTSATPNLASQLAAHLTFANPGSDLEQSLLSIKTSLSSANLAANTGFFRSDAMLAIIMLSDDMDRSPGKWQDYAAFFDSIKKPFPSGARSWVANYVGHLTVNESCGVIYNAGLGYLDLVNYSGGVSQSICNNDWSSTMNNIQVIISQLMTTYYFSVQPNPASIIVKVNGVVQMSDLQNGWTLQSSGTGASAKWFLQFHGTGIPSLYSNVSVTFTPAGAN